jgi:hypothetical protein
MDEQLRSCNALGDANESLDERHDAMLDADDLDA